MKKRIVCFLFLLLLGTITTSFGQSVWQRTTTPSPGSNASKSIWMQMAEKNAEVKQSEAYASFSRDGYGQHTQYEESSVRGVMLFEPRTSRTALEFRGRNSRQYDYGRQRQREVYRNYPRSYPQEYPIYRRGGYYNEYGVWQAVGILIDALSTRRVYDRGGCY